MRDKPSCGAVTIQMTRGTLLILIAALLCPWAIILLVNSPSKFQQINPAVALERHAKLHQMVPVRNGPWGDLRRVRIVTEPPAESLASYLKYDKPTWLFKGYTPETYDKLLASAALSDTQRAALKEAAKWGPPGEGCIVIPPDDLVISLTPQSRAVLYGALSLFPENTFQNEPFRYHAEFEHEWLDGSTAPKEVLDKVKRLMYRRGRTLLFSDPHLVLPELPSDQERVRLLKTLARQSTLMVFLHISQGADTFSLLNYWAPREGRAKNIAPLLDSASRIEGGVDIDIVHLLPRFARKRLYTYPTTDGDAGETIYDCHWNTMNFWNDPPDNRFADSAFVIQTLETEYEPVLDDFRFGDIILFMKSETQAIHSAIFIADDIVFTKNGPSQHSPWIFMQMDMLISHYETNVDLSIRGYRKIKKQAPTQ